MTEARWSLVRRIAVAHYRGAVHEPSLTGCGGKAHVLSPGTYVDDVAELVDDSTRWPPKTVRPRSTSNP
ncbi:hypothetical protein [Amycolatopsis sp. NPDC051903]|uniref:hypothetical protein n=1 Tax=Amycolatopsis sp. NPDC051903 TaxID=3363936 RepID=UPI0037A256CF